VEMEFNPQLKPLIGHEDEQDRDDGLLQIGNE
jgi:hypothetical protein